MPLLEAQPVTVQEEKQEHEFYARVLSALSESSLPFLVGGAQAVMVYTGVPRRTKDLDLFVRAGDYPALLGTLQQRGFQTMVEDERWIAKAVQEPFFVDIIFGSANAVTPVTPEWFKESRSADFFGVRARLLPPTELIWSKLFVQDRFRYDGADVAHVLWAEHAAVDWARLLGYAEQYWEVLLMHLLNFRFIYPTERDKIPRPVLDQLLSRLNDQQELPKPGKKVCRGRLFSRSDYELDLREWGFADLIG